MKIIIMVILFSLVVFSISGNTIVQFIDGFLEVRDGNTWQKLSPGDSVSNESVVRLGKNTVVELSCEKSKYTLTQPGTYLIDSLIKKDSFSDALDSASSTADSLMLLKGTAHLQLGDIEIAKSIFQQIKGHNPESEYSKLADDYLVSM